MRKKCRSFSREFKRDLIAESDAGFISKSKAARDHDIAYSVIDKWQKKIRAGAL